MKTFKRFVVGARKIKINNDKLALNAFEGMTLDPNLNKGDTEMKAFVEYFDNETRAMNYLNSFDNYYDYNPEDQEGDVLEYWMDVEELDAGGNVIRKEIGAKICKNSGLEWHKTIMQGWIEDGYMSADGEE